MTPLDPGAELLDDPTDDPDDPAHAPGHLLDLIAAVDHLNRGFRPGFTVWHALDEAITWWLQTPDADHSDRPIADDGGSLETRLRALLDQTGHEAGTTELAMQQAIRRWTTTMAHRCNASYHWPHPTARRQFPPALLES